MLDLFFSLLTLDPLKHYGICDASAAVPYGETSFYVGNDEDNILRLYDAQKSGKAMESVDLKIYLPPQDKGELDIEGVTTLGGLSYWITSHGRSKKGNLKPKRHQFFAVKFFDNDSILQVVGKPYSKLVLPDMVESEKLAQFDLKTAETLKPKSKGGLNIEGLTTTPDGNILIGFRNPIPDGKALLVPLHNSHTLVTSNNDNVKAQFGDPILLDLKGLGVRSIEYWPALKIYIIVAGPYDSGDNFTLYQWSGNPREQPKLIDVDLPDDFRPESVLFYPHLSDRFQLLSDDGTIIRVGNQPCKDIDDPTNPEKYFRSIWIKVESN